MHIILTKLQYFATILRYNSGDQADNSVILLSGLRYQVVAGFSGGVRFSGIRYNNDKEIQLWVFLPVKKH